jgi:DNA-binding CsgD family transcriptional regulator
MAFVERSSKLDVLKRSLADCWDGRGGVVMITGAVGTGKSELLRTFARHAVQSGATYFGATAARAERELALGVLDQLLVRADLPADQARRAARLLEDGGLTATLHESETEAVQQVNAPVLHGLTETLLGMATRAPLLIAVDDVHNADVASLQCLMYLIRRAVRSRVLLVVTEATWARQPRPMFRADLLSQPHCRQLRIHPLSQHGVASVLAERLGRAGTSELATACHQISGGNPLILGALVEDSLATGRQTPEPAVGDAFGQAVLSCLYRSDATILDLARVLAVLGEPAPPALIGELLGVDEASATRTMDTATEAALLEGGQFRHPRARAAVLDAMEPTERVSLHERAAAVLYKNGAPAEVVARHKVAANRVGASWSVPVLREAAEHALQSDATSLALGCLRLAERASGDETERTAIRFALVRAKWRLDPATAERHIADLLAAIEAGHLTGRHAVALADYLLWHGRVDEAVALLDRVDQALAPGDSDTAIALYGARARQAFIAPGQAVHDGRRTRPLPSIGGATTGNLALRAAGLIDTLMADGPVEEIVDDAECILQQARLDDAAGHPILIALEALTYADCLDRAASWCDPLLREAEARKAPTWCAILSAVRAMISFRQGDLVAAERHARASLSHTTAKSLGVLIGIPLSVLVRTATMAGEHEQAMTHLNMPVPATMLDTRYGLLYLRARGHRYLAGGNHQAAVADFELCRDLMVKWRLDLPGLVPWRTDLAEAALACSETATAQDLIQEQLARLDSRNARTRGITLRLLATTLDVGHRRAVLHDAVEVLRDSGDQLELARAKEVHGDRTGLTIRAAQAARRVGDGVRRFSHPDPGMLAEITELSDAERRVAELAAQGHTNRQIAHRLYVTVSTVEQHLTKVYRKLRINRRTDLPLKLLQSLD